MFNKNPLQKYLGPIVKKLTDYQLVELSTAFGNTTAYTELLLSGKAWFSTKEAIAFGKITGTDPAVLLNAQTEAQLQAEGVKPAAQSEELSAAAVAAAAAPVGAPVKKSAKASKGILPSRGSARRPVRKNTGSSW